MEQGTQEWLDARKGLITGSRVGAIIGVNPYSKPEDVMREMVRQHFGLPAEFQGNEATQFGNDHEPIALQDYEVFTGNDVERVGLITCPDMPYLAVSPDGLIGSSAGLEIKCPFSGVLSSIKDKPHYYAQVCLSLIVTNRKAWHFWTWTSTGSQLETVTKEEALQWWSTYSDTINAFYSRYVETIASDELSEPYLADLEVDLSDDADWVAAVESYLTAKDAEIVAKNAVTAAKNALEKMANAQPCKRVRGGGVTMTKANRQGTINYSAIPELKTLDLEQYRGKPSQYWVIK
jgi:putative phage-type endonuclease